MEPWVYAAKRVGVAEDKVCKRAGELFRVIGARGGLGKKDCARAAISVEIACQDVGVRVPTSKQLAACSGLGPREYGLAFRMARNVLAERSATIVASRVVPSVVLASPERFASRIGLPPALSTRARAVLRVFSKRRKSSGDFAFVEDPTWITAALMVSAAKCRAIIKDSSAELPPDMPENVPSPADIRQKLVPEFHLSAVRVGQAVQALEEACPEVAVSKPKKPTKSVAKPPKTSTRGRRLAAQAMSTISVTPAGSKRARPNDLTQLSPESPKRSSLR